MTYIAVTCLLWMLICNSPVSASFYGEQLSNIGKLYLSSRSPVSYSTLQQAQLAYYKIINSSPSLLQSLPAVSDTSADMCYNQTDRLFTGISTGKLWALPFLDSFGKLPAGVLTGNQLWLGNYDECMAASAPQLFDTIQGRYCLIPIQLWMKNHTKQDMSVGLGLCLPDSCNADMAGEVAKSLVARVNPFLGTTNFTLVVPYPNISISCKVPRGQLPWSWEAIFMICLLILFGTVIVSATMYDLWLRKDTSYGSIRIEGAYPHWVLPTRSEERSSLSESSPLLRSGNNTILPTEPTGLSKPVKCFLAFSAFSNANKLLAMSHQPDSLTCVNGIRVISLSWVILGHVVYINLANIANFGQEVQVWLNHWTFQAVVNATLSVDTFFVLSGMLSTFLFFRELSQHSFHLRRLNWIMFYLHRYWRLTPPYLLVLGTSTTLFRYWYDGPLYPQEREGFDTKCLTSWWKNALYINNLVYEPKGALSGCMAWSWYLANDMQFYVISPLFLVALALKPVVGIILIMVALLGSIIATAVVSSLNNISAGNIDLNALNFDSNTLVGVDLYTKPWFRIVPYLVGMVTGFVLHKVSLKKSNLRMVLPFHVKLIGWLLAALLCLTVVYSLYDVYGGRVTLSHHVAAVYNSLHRLAWSIGVSWVIFVCVTGNGSFINRFLSQPIFAPLSRLTYCAYLVHPIVIVFFVVTRRQTLIWDDLTIPFMFVYCFVFSYAVAFLTSLAFESPLIAVEKELRNL